MTCVVVRDVLDPRALRRSVDTLLVEERHHVAHLPGEGVRLLGAEELADVHQMGAASGGVHDDDVGVGERAKVPFGEPSRGVEVPVVRRERPAAHLTPWNDDPPTVAREDADRRSVDASEPPVLHAAREDRGRALGLAAGGG
jgi:hypothetical protein